jgi:hypothetical protein
LIGAPDGFFRSAVGREFGQSVEGMTAHDAFEGVAQVGFRIAAIQFGRLQQGDGYDSARREALAIIGDVSSANEGGVQ